MPQAKKLPSSTRTIRGGGKPINGPFCGMPTRRKWRYFRSRQRRTTQAPKLCWARSTQASWAWTEPGPIFSTTVESCRACWAHLDRHFQRMEDRGGKSIAIGQAGKAEVDHFFKLWREFKDNKLSRLVLQVAVGSVRVNMAKLLARGIQCGESGKTKSVHSKTAKTCANIL